MPDEQIVHPGKVASQVWQDWESDPANKANPVPQELQKEVLVQVKQLLRV